MSSGEWISIQSALTEAVSGLRTEVQTGLSGMRNDMRGEFSDVRAQLTQIHSNLATGSATMDFQAQLLERERKRIDDEIVTRLDAHSDLFKKLPSSAPVVVAPPTAVDRTWTKIKNKAIEATVTALVLGALGVAYNLWRDQTIKDAVDEHMRTREAAHTPGHAPAPLTAPVGP